MKCSNLAWSCHLDEIICFIRPLLLMIKRNIRLWIMNTPSRGKLYIEKTMLPIAVATGSCTARPLLDESSLGAFVLWMVFSLFSMKTISYFNLTFPRSRDISVVYLWATGWIFEPRRGLGIFLLTTASRLVLGPIQPPVQWVPGAPSLGVKPPSNAEFEECVELYIYSTDTPSWRGAQLKQGGGQVLLFLPFRNAYFNSKLRLVSSLWLKIHFF
jgi:hypothetical protein